MARRANGYRLWSGIVIFLTGLGLCGLQAVSILFTTEPKSTPTDSGIAGYDYYVLTSAEYNSEIEQVQKEFGVNQDAWQAATKINQLVFLTLCHDGTAQISPNENWIQWVAGKFYHPLAPPFLASEILQRHKGICSDACRLEFLELQKLGIPARFVGLNGHVILEADILNQWQMLDPDFGVSSPFSAEVIAADAAANQTESNGPAWQPLAQQLTDQGFSDTQIEYYRSIISSSSDNQTSKVNEFLNPRLYCFAVVTRWLSPIFAIVFCLVGIAMLKSE